MHSCPRAFYLTCITAFVLIAPSPLKADPIPLSYLDDCHREAINAVLRSAPDLTSRVDDFRPQIDFDCQEASLIWAIDKPAVTATEGQNLLGGLLNAPRGLSFSKPIITILSPYCRSDNEIYGRFCMATDIDAANELLANPKLLRQLPLVVAHAASWLATQEQVNLVDAVYDVYDGPQKEAVLLAGFLGLDDNGIQFDRLRADLLWSKRYDDYAQVFMISARYAFLGDLKLTENLETIFFATRIGKITLPGLEDGTRKTYKAYAGLYMGCRLAEEETPALVVAPLAFSIGASYELLKLMWSSARTWDEFRNHLEEHAAAANITGKNVSLGAIYGYSQCATARPRPRS